MRLYGFLLGALSVVPVRSVFSDEAYQLDFHQALLGLPRPHTTFFHKPDAASSAALLYTLSDKNVLGAVNPRDGSLVWRQSIAESPNTNSPGLLIAGDNDGKITAAHGSTVTSWDASYGRLVWSHTIKNGGHVLDLQPVPVHGGSGVGAVQDVIVLSKTQAGAVTVNRLGGDGSGEKWSFHDSSSTDATLALATAPKQVYYISRSAGIISGSKTKIVILDIATGKQVKDYSLSMDGEVVPVNGKTTVIPTENQFIVASEKPYKTLKFNVLGMTKVSTITLEDKGEEIVSIKVHFAAGIGVRTRPHFLVHVTTKSKQWAEIYHINSNTAEVTRAFSLPATSETSAFFLIANAGKVFITRVTNTEVLVYSTESHGELARWPRKTLGLGYSSSHAPVWAVAEVAAKDDAKPAIRVAVVSPEGSWYLARNGDTQWSRPEMLAYADLAAWSDDVELSALAQELRTDSSDPVTAYISRLSRHIKELLSMPAWLTSLPQRLFAPTDDSAKRQTLVGSKSIILKTSRNQLFSVDAVHGKVDWHTNLAKTVPGGSSIKSLTTQEGRVTMYTSHGGVIVVNATTGHVIEQLPGKIAAERLIELPGSPASTLLKIDHAGVPHLASDLSPSTPAEGNSVLTLGNKGEVLGWTVGTDIKKIWTFKPSKGNAIQLSLRPEHDPIASIGKVLGDRSVLYKYFTPNLALVTSMSADVVTFDLIDAVTGSILYSSAYAGVLPSYPISSIISENWLAYTFTSADPETKAVTTRLIISELYESDVPNDRGALSSKTNYTSFGADAITRPHVLSAAFSLTEPITNLTVTQTTQGITTRNLLAYLPGSQAIVSIPRYILDARRPKDRDANAAEQEEGLFRYQPNLDLDPKSFLSHSREVFGIQQIMTTPTLLESTSMVFAFGHDIFGTQAAPSQTFDILGKSFKRGQLLATVVALYFGVLAVRPLVRRKVVERGWM